MNLRLNKFLARAGIDSRRKVEEIIKAGLVTINGNTCKEFFAKVDPEKDIVKVDGKRVKIEKGCYYAFYKPKGIVSTLSDPEGRRCIGDFISKLPKGLKPVGRLDWSSEGLIFLTNDGDWAQKIQHPKYNIRKIYRVKVQGIPDEKVIKKWRNGMKIDGKHQKMEYVNIINKTKGKHSWLEIHLIQGYTHQIKKMCTYMGHPAEKIKRIGIGNIKLLNLKPGEMRKLKEKEINSLLKGGKGESSRKY